MSRRTSTTPRKVKVFATKVAANQFDAIGKIKWNTSEGEPQETSARFYVEGDQLMISGVQQSSTPMPPASLLERLSQTYEKLQDARNRRRSTTNLFAEFSELMADVQAAMTPIVPELPSEPESTDEEPANEAEESSGEEVSAVLRESETSEEPDDDDGLDVNDDEEDESDDSDLEADLD